MHTVAGQLTGNPEPSTSLPTPQGAAMARRRYNQQVFLLTISCKSKLLPWPQDGYLPQLEQLSRQLGTWVSWTNTKSEHFSTQWHLPTLTLSCEVSPRGGSSTYWIKWCQEFLTTNSSKAVTWGYGAQGITLSLLLEVFSYNKNSELLHRTTDCSETRWRHWCGPGDSGMPY